MSAFSPFAAASRKVLRKTPIASFEAGKDCLSGRLAPPRPSSPCTYLASMIGCVSGRSAPLCTGMSTPSIEVTARRLVVACSMPTLPNTVVITSGTSPLATSRISACASSTPPSLSKIKVRLVN